MFRKVIVYKYVGFGSDRTKAQDVIGAFHQWGTESTEFENGGVQYTVAIVEKDDGSVCTPMPNMIQFVKE